MTLTLDLLHIGEGACGSVWAAPVDSAEGRLAYKRADGGRGPSLANDFEMHRRIEHSLAVFNRDDIHRANSDLEIPHCHQRIASTDTPWWTANLARFPQGYQACEMIVSDRIYPVSLTVREQLIARYCPSQLQDRIRTASNNECCLIRPYFGRERRRTSTTARDAPKLGTFSLRNFQLYLDQMHEMHLSPSHQSGLVRTMATTLAVIHWIAKADGNDIEFVLAAPRASTQTDADSDSDSDSDPDPGSNSDSLALADHALWLLDFDLCHSMAMTPAGVAQAVNAFFSTDGHFYPRPGQQLWESFSEAYLTTSLAILDNSPEKNIKQLPSLFIEGIEEREHSMKAIRRHNS